jgi:hypothetical protein
MDLSLRSDRLELERVEADLVTGEQTLALLVTSVLALQRDARLREQFGNVRTAIALGEFGPYVIVERGVIVGSALGVLAPDEPVTTIEEALAAAPWLIEEFQTSLRHTSLEASRTISTIATGAETVSRAAFGKLERWAPLLAMHAYRHTVSIQSIFDLTRTELRSTTNPDRLRRYWERAHLLGHLTVLAASTPSRDWLVEMSHSFAWRTWTPSFPLVRERILRLAVRGGWAGARFGVSVIAPYLQRLALGRPLHVFDAALALVSLATAFESERDPIAAELFPILRDHEDAADDPDVREAFAAMTRSARLVLDSPRRATQLAIERRPLAGSGDRVEQLLGAVDTDDDAGTIDDHGMYPAILAMAELATIEASQFFAEQPAPSRWRPDRARRVLERTSRPARPELN